MQKEDQNKKGKINTLPDELKNSNPFLVPEGYFEKLPDAIRKRIHERGAAKRRMAGRKIILWAASGMAAAVIALLMVFYFLLPPSSDHTGLTTNTELALTEADVEDYLINNAAISEEEIIEVMLSNGANHLSKRPVNGNPDSISLQKKISGEIVRDTSITDEDILDFLTDEDYEPEL